MTPPIDRKCHYAILLDKDGNPIALGEGAAIAEGVGQVLVGGRDSGAAARTLELERDASDGRSRLLVQGRAVASSRDLRWAPWTKDQTVGGSFAEVWSTPALAAPALVHELAWRTNSDRVQVRISCNGVVVFDFELRELTGDYGFDDSPNFSLYEYANNRWRLRPPVAWRVEPGGSLRVEMQRTQGGGKTLESGIAVWGTE